MTEIVHRVYRFHDKVAVSLSGLASSPTVYLSQETAARIGMAMGEFAADINKVKFTTSTLTTREFQEEE